MFMGCNAFICRWVEGVDGYPVSVEVLSTRIWTGRTVVGLLTRPFANRLIASPPIFASGLNHNPHDWVINLAPADRKRGPCF